MNDQTQAVFLVGANPIPVRVQAEVLQNASKGPEMTIQGIANNRERRIRVLSALASVGLNNHVKVTVSLPDNKHEYLIGGVLDLAIAVSVLEATGKIKSRGFTFIGELGLDGSLRPVRGVLPMVMHCRTPVYVPTANAQEAAAAHGEVCHASSLKDVIKAFSTGTHTRTKHAELQPRPALVDLADIKGHEPAKRALEIAAAGGHHLLLIGPLGSGKSVLAKALQGILPELSQQEALESASVHSIAGLLSNEPSSSPPFRAPHHTVSSVGLVGGGEAVRPGEASLAHNGVLLLDELTEYRRVVLDALRPVLDTRKAVLYSRRVCVEYPANCIAVGCVCTNDAHRQTIQAFAQDRFAITLRSGQPDLTGQAGESSAVVRARVTKARTLQAARAERLRLSATINDRMSAHDLGLAAPLTAEVAQMLHNAAESYDMTTRAQENCIKVARTIADLAGSEEILTDHMAEAITHQN